MNDIQNHERNRQIRIALIPFAIAVPALTFAGILWFVSPFERDLNSILFGIVGAILAFDLPVCVLVLIQWTWTGEPPELSLVPLVPSREERELRTTIRERPKLDGGEFYNRFYADSSIPKSLATKLRALLEYQLGLPNNSIEPNDNLFNADPELDWQYLMDEINDEFNVVVSDESMHKMDGTFDNLLKNIATQYDDTVDNNAMDRSGFGRRVGS
ncbi:hypothetical protein N9X53_07505 [Mariniblastus sp.]|nr:hypothetical protein [Mariniblastus sp.]MDB2526515.1 hypothetical protein [Mariniblastus sp.]